MEPGFPVVTALKRADPEVFPLAPCKFPVVCSGPNCGESAGLPRLRWQVTEQARRCHQSSGERRRPYGAVGTNPENIAADSGVWPSIIKPLNSHAKPVEHDGAPGIAVPPWSCRGCPVPQPQKSEGKPPMAKLIRFLDDDRKGRWANLLMNNNDPCWIGIVQTGVLVKKSAIGMFGAILYGAILYEEKNIYEAGRTAEALHNLYPIDLTPPEMWNPVLKAFTNAVLHCSDLGQVTRVLNEAISDYEAGKG